MVPVMSDEGNTNMKIKFGKRCSRWGSTACRREGLNSACQVKEDFLEEVRPKLSQRRNC